MRTSGCSRGWLCGLALVACTAGDGGGETDGTAASTSTGSVSSTDASSDATGGVGSAGATGSSTVTAGSSTSVSGGTTGGASGSTSGGTTGGVRGCTGVEVFANDFDDDAPGTYADLADWNEPAWDNGVSDGRVEIVGGVEAFSGQSLRVHYPQGGVGPGEGGAQWMVPLGAAHDELYLSYRVRFAAGFEFVLGGKLPGLVGGSAPTGCVADNSGFSARGMWRADGAAVQYMYYPDKISSCGDDFEYTSGGDAFAFSPGTWHQVEHRIRMNTSGQANGVLQAWVDGELVLDLQDFEYRAANGSYQVDALYFSTFFGGSSAEWAPTKDEYVDYDDFVVCTGPITH